MARSASADRERQQPGDERHGAPARPARSRLPRRRPRRRASRCAGSRAGAELTGRRSRARGSSPASPRRGPSASPRSSIDANGCSSRAAMIFAAVTGPIPGSVSSCSAVARLRSMGPRAPPDCRRRRPCSAAAAAGALAASPRTGTWTSSPSRSGAARLSCRSASAASTRGPNPPAAVDRVPDARTGGQPVHARACATAPPTSTTSGPALAAAGPVGWDRASTVDAASPTAPSTSIDRLGPAR